MTRQIFVCYIIAASQLVLGAIYLFAPQWFIAWQGLTPIAQDMGYPLAMLAARFLVYGVGMIVIARNFDENRFWLDGMIAIQAIDLLAGVFYTTTGTVLFADAILPMFNASMFIGLMIWIRQPATKTGRLQHS